VAHADRGEPIDVARRQPAGNRRPFVEPLPAGDILGVVRHRFFRLSSW
jgi:hypothetical protein